MIHTTLGCGSSATPPEPETGTASNVGGNTLHVPDVPGARWLVENGESVFFVGNSFMGGEADRLNDLIETLAANQEAPFTIHTGSHIVYGNQPLSWFFEQTESQDAIASGQYKVFVLQGEDREPVDHEEEFKQSVRDYHAAVSAHGGTIMLFMTWDFIWEANTTFFEDLSSAYEEIGAELGVPVIPIGLIYDDCNQHPYGDEQPYWLTSQELHQNEKGTAVNAYATFAMLTGSDPNAGRYFEPGTNWLEPDLLQYLSDAAWSRVEPRLR